MAIYSDEPFSRIPFNNDPSFWEGNSGNCNCGSYALNITDWYYPYPERQSFEAWIVEMTEDGVSMERMRDIIFYNNVYNIERQFEDYLIPIESPHDVVTCVDVIAFRISLTGTSEHLLYDFHFKLRHDGKWTEKMGWDDVRECELKPDEPWYEDEDLIYSGPIKYFSINPFAKE